MPKDQNGKFTPIKGKPSGNRKEGLGLRKSISPDELETDLEMTDKYTMGPDELQPAVHMRHPNRDTVKKAVQQQNVREAPADKTVEETYDKEHAALTSKRISGKPDKEIFTGLAAQKSNICLSIYLPTHSSGKEVNEQQDLILFKNMLQKSQKLLEEKKTDTTLIQRLLQPGYELLRDDQFWRNQQEGLACFFSENSFRYLQLPMAVQEQIYCNNSFMLTPLLPIISSNEQFYLLVFSKHDAKLFLADGFGMQEISVEGMPNGMDDVIHFEEKGDARQLFRQGSVGGGQSASYHGLNQNADHKTYIANYLEEVDKTIWKEVLSDKHIPLMMAAVDYLQPIYRKTSRYQYIAEEALTGNFEHEKPANIYRQAREKMQPYFEKRQQVALERYYNASASALTSSIPDDVIPATYYGQVDCLFVEKGAHLWGTFNANENRVIIHEKEEPKDECLLNNAIAQTILHNGDVFILEKDKMPAQSNIAASLRYA